MSGADARAEEGRRRRERAQGPRAAALQEALELLSPEMPGIADEVIFGRMWDRAHLDHEEQMIIALTALVCRGKTNQLRLYLFGALGGGMSPEKLHDLILMCAVYAGFPESMDALVVLRDVRQAVERRRAADGGPG